MSKRRLFAVFALPTMPVTWGQAAAGPAPGRRFGGDHGLRQTFDLWLRRARTRRRLNELSDRELRDVGLDRGAVIREANKPFWQG